MRPRKDGLLSGCRVGTSREIVSVRSSSLCYFSFEIKWIGEKLKFVFIFFARLHPPPRNVDLFQLDDLSISSCTKWKIDSLLRLFSFFRHPIYPMWAARGDDEKPFQSGWMKKLFNFMLYFFSAKLFFPISSFHFPISQNKSRICESIHSFRNIETSNFNKNDNKMWWNSHENWSTSRGRENELTCRAELRIFYSFSFWRLREISIRPNQNIDIRIIWMLNGFSDVFFLSFLLLAGPLFEVQTAEGLDVTLPCDLFPNSLTSSSSSSLTQDKVSLVIWYKEGNSKPIYS